jgi:hypothetical protein
VNYDLLRNECVFQSQGEIQMNYRHRHHRGGWRGGFPFFIPLLFFIWGGPHAFPLVIVALAVVAILWWLIRLASSNQLNAQASQQQQYYQPTQQQPYYEPPQPAQPTQLPQYYQPPQPSYPGYEQGYKSTAGQPHLGETYQEAGQQYQYAEAESSTVYAEDEQPQAQYPTQLPPQIQ